MTFFRKLFSTNPLMLIKSIRFRFIIWYTLILSMTFLLFSFILYYYFSHSLLNEFDTRLQLKAEGLVHSIETYWETEKIEARKYGSDKHVYNKINNENFIKMAQRWMRDKIRNLDLTNLVVQIYDPQGKPIASKAGTPKQITLSQKTLGFILQGESHQEDFHLEGKGKKLLHYRVFSMPVMENDIVAYIVQIAGSVSTIDQSMTNLKYILFLLLPLTVLTTSVFAGEFLASLTLKPLKKMIETVDLITASQTKVRITLPESKDEIKELAQTFNNMLEKIDQAMSAQKQFIQDVSHELRTPLTILKGEFETTLKRARSKEEYISILHSNLEEINRIHQMVEDLLILARFDNDQLVLKAGSCDLVALLSDLAEDMDILASQKKIKINFIPTDYFNLNADKEKIRRVFLNLIDNAIKYTDENGSIIIETSKEEKMGRISIKDTGIGIAPEDIPYVLNRFYQADKSRKSKGYGLGLSIAKSIVEAHGGSISLKSELNKGTEFILRFPLFNKT